MIYRVKINDQIFDVEINNLDSRPIIALVNGTEIEVWPEERAAIPIRGINITESEKKNQIEQRRPTSSISTPMPVSASQSDQTKVVVSPLPGTVHSITVQPGTEVSVGQELLIIESMKMKNAIRASRSGKIARLFVSTGQSIKHQAPLLEFED